MARATIPTINPKGGTVTEPAPITLDGSGGILPNARQILRLHNPGDSAVNVTVHSVFARKADDSGNVFDIDVSVPAGSTVYGKIVDTAFYVQSDGTIYVDGTGIDALTIAL